MLLAKKISDMTEEERTAHELKKEEEKAKKQALQEEKTRQFVAFTDLLNDLYLERGIEPNFPMMMSQAKRYIETYGYTYPSMTFTMKYMVAKGVNIFGYEQGSILNLLPYYHNEAKNYYEQTVAIKKGFKNFKPKDESRTVVYKQKKRRKLLHIDFD